LENFPGSYFSSILFERGLRNLRYREIEFAGDGSPSETPSGLAKAIANYQRFAKKISFADPQRIDSASKTQQAVRRHACECL
jgi:hypothetical protein